jgi:hypothetical protein
MTGSRKTKSPLPFRVAGLAEQKVSAQITSLPGGSRSKTIGKKSKHTCACDAGREQGGGVDADGHELEKVSTS